MFYTVSQYIFFKFFTFFVLFSIHTCSLCFIFLWVIFILFHRILIFSFCTHITQIDVNVSISLWIVLIFLIISNYFIVLILTEFLSNSSCHFHMFSCFPCIIINHLSSSESVFVILHFLSYRFVYSHINFFAYILINFQIIWSNLYFFMFWYKICFIPYILYVWVRSLLCCFCDCFIFLIFF